VTHRVVSSNAADTDVANTADYYAEVAGPELALRFIDAVEASVRRIGTFPSAGSSAPEAETGISGLRGIAVSGFPFRLLYTRHALRVAAISNDRWLGIGFCVDPGAVPDVELLADAAHDAWEALRADAL